MELTAQSKSAPKIPSSFFTSLLVIKFLSSFVSVSYHELSLSLLSFAERKRATKEVYDLGKQEGTEIDHGIVDLKDLALPSLTPGCRHRLRLPSPMRRAAILKDLKQRLNYQTAFLSGAVNQAHRPTRLNDTNGTLLYFAFPTKPLAN